MDGSGPQNQNQNRPQGAPHQQQASLIRPEQVARLPQLNPQQKQSYQGAVTRCWEALNTLSQSDPKYNEAYQALVRTSQTLMQGMKNYQQAARQKQMLQQQQQVAQNAAQAQAAQQAATVPGPASSQQPGGPNSMPFNQLHVDIQQKVNEQHFYYPPAMVEGTKSAEEWLREAKARYGQALQRLHVARNKKAEFEKQARQRSSSGNPLNPDESQVFNSKVAQCTKAITESQTFMEKFKQQQNDFRNAMTAQQYTKQPGQEGQGQAPPPPSAGGINLQPGMQTQQDGPQAHSISSAVSAAASARNRQQQDQTATQATVPTQAGPSGSPVNPNAAASQPGATPVKSEGANANVFPTSTHPDAPTSAGPHRPPSHGGMPQSALSQHPSSQSIHAHPLSASINGAKPVTAQAITKNLQVTEPKPVPMPPARPTLNGGAGVGTAGPLGQPAITTLPGYVLESSEDGRLLSKKKLNELVREVVGLGKEGAEEESSMSAEAEEVCYSPSTILIAFYLLIDSGFPPNRR